MKRRRLLKLAGAATASLLGSNDASLAAPVDAGSGPRGSIAAARAPLPVRMGFLRLTALACAFLCFAAGAWSQPIEIGSRLELFVDDHVIERLAGEARRRLHRPTPRELAITYDKPWEGNNSAYVTVFRDGDIYRMYYRGRQIDLSSGKLVFTHEQVICYAESRDGIHWTRPNLGLIEFEGSKQNNIIWQGVGSHNFAPFKDANPAAAPGARYKALGGVKSEGGLYAFQSPDGIHWSKTRDEPVITKGYFDSQNLAFWDTGQGEYREYHREFREGRDIMTSASTDFLSWGEAKFIAYSPGRLTQLYTNQILPYYRAPHILLGFPTRYIAGRGHLTPFNERLSKVSMRYGTDYTDGGFMASRDRLHFKMWDEAFIRPGPLEEGRWVYGGNYQNWGLVETAAAVSGSPNEISVYSSEGNGWEGPGVGLRRYTLRIDGFVSVEAPLVGGELLTKPLTFAGSELVLNFSTSAAGSVQVELQDEKGMPIENFTLADCPEMYGDSIERKIEWKQAADVRALQGRAVRLRFVIKDADVYSFRFR